MVSLEVDRLLERLRRRGVRLVPDEAGQIRVLSHPGYVSPEMPTAQEWEMLRRCKPQILTRLRPPSLPSGAPGVGLALAAAVAPPDRSAIHRLFGRLAGDLDGSLAGELALRLHGAFRDVDPTRSLALYAGLAREACGGTGGISPGLLADAFDAACGPKVGNRGATFVFWVRRLKSEVLSRRRITPGSGMPS